MPISNTPENTDRYSKFEGVLPAVRCCGTISKQRAMEVVLDFN